MDYDTSNICWENIYSNITSVQAIITNLKIITSTVDLSAVEIELVDFEKREFVLKNYLKEIVNYFDYNIQQNHTLDLICNYYPNHLYKYF